MILRAIFLLLLACPLFAGELEDAKAEFAKQDREMKQVLADLQKSLRARLLVMVENDQEDWRRYRDSMSDFQARLEDPDESVERWGTAAHITEERVAWLKGWKIADERKGWTGHYMDSHGGSLNILEKDGQTFFTLQVVRGPTFHNGQIGGPLKIDGEKASYQTRPFPEDEPTIITISPVNDGSGRLEVDGKNTGYFHGARAYFQGQYLWTGELSKEQQKEMEKQLKEGFE